MKRTYLLGIIWLICLVSHAQRTFTLPDIPSILNTPSDRANYLTEHYWDHFDFKDTTYLHLPAITEQALVDFMDLMNHVEAEQVGKALSILYRQAATEPKMAAYFWKTMSGYWNDPNSPMRNDDFFIALCRAVEKEDRIDIAIRSIAAFKRKVTSRNKVGITAADFVYTLASGRQARMSQLEAPYLILCFHNPECGTCAENLYAMKRSSLLVRMLESKHVAVLTLYPDEDINLWRKHLHELSPQWINAFDQGHVLMDENRYYLNALPSFYLLDKDKKVVLKDVLWADIERFLEEI